MKINSYNPVTMGKIGDDITGISFGNVVRGGYTSSPVVIKPEAETETVSQMAFFLEENGALSNTTFRHFSSSTAIPGVGQGDARLSGQFTEQNGVSDFSNYASISGNGIPLTANDPEYMWVDMLVGASETLGSNTSINYRLIFEYS